MSPETIALLTTRAFLLALVIGAVATGGVYLLGGMWLKERHTTVPLAGFALAVGFVLSGPKGLDVAFLVGLVAVGAAASLPFTPGIRAVATIPGAVLVAMSVETELWVRVLAVLVIVVGGALAAEFDLRYADESLGPLLVPVVAVGVFFGVPDTEVALSLLGIGLPFVFLAWPHPRASLGRGGAPVAVAVITWVTMLGTIGRPTAFLGATAVLGLLVVEPVVTQFVGRRIEQPAWVVAGAQLVIVYLASRVAAPRGNVLMALLLTSAVAAIAAGITLALYQQPSGVRS